MVEPVEVGTGQYLFSDDGCQLDCRQAGKDGSPESLDRTMLGQKPANQASATGLLSANDRGAEGNGVPGSYLAKQF